MKLQQSSPPSLSRQTLIVHIKHPNPHIHCNISHLLLFYTFSQFQYEFLRDAQFLIRQLNVNVILDCGDKILLQFTPTDNCHIVEVEPSWYSLFYCTLSLLSTLVNFEKLCQYPTVYPIPCFHMLGWDECFGNKRNTHFPRQSACLLRSRKL